MLRSVISSFLKKYFEWVIMKRCVVLGKIRMKYRFKYMRNNGKRKLSKVLVSERMDQNR